MGDWIIANGRAHRFGYKELKGMRKEPISYK
jgi:hypothetical protein